MIREFSCSSTSIAKVLNFQIKNIFSFVKLYPSELMYLTANDKISAALPLPSHTIVGIKGSLNFIFQNKISVQNKFGLIRLKVIGRRNICPMLIRNFLLDNVFIHGFQSCSTTFHDCADYGHLKIFPSSSICFECSLFSHEFPVLPSSSPNFGASECRPHI